MNDPKNILVRAPNWIGDQVIALPFYYYLRKAYPRARIVSACSFWVESLQFRDLVDEVIVLPKLTRKGWLPRIELQESCAKELKKRGPWDLGIALPNSFSSAWQFFRAGVEGRRGYSTDSRGFLLNQKISWKSQATRHRGDDYLELLPEEVRVRLQVRPAIEFWGRLPENDLDQGIPGVLEGFDAQRAWPDTLPLEAPESDFWVLAPGSTAEARRWPAERFLSLARRIAEETGWIGVIVGGAAESKLAAQLAGGPLLDYTAKGSVSGLWRLFRQAKFTVANDSGLAHVAALCGCPVQVVWGAGDPKKTRPLGPGPVQLAVNAVDCWPCERNFCDRTDERRLDCLGGISVEAVWKEIQSGILNRASKEGCHVDASVHA